MNRNSNFNSHIPEDMMSPQPTAAAKGRTLFCGAKVRFTKTKTKKNNDLGAQIVSCEICFRSEGLRPRVLRKCF